MACSGLHREDRKAEEVERQKWEYCYFGQISVLGNLWGDSPSVWFMNEDGQTKEDASIRGGYGEKEVAVTLHKLGNEGWEMIAPIPISDGNLLFIFKRPKE